MFPRRKLTLIKLRIKLALIVLRMRFTLMSQRGVSGKRVAMMSAMIVLIGLSPITVSSTIMALKRKSLVIPSGGSVNIVTPPGVDVGVYWDSGCSSLVSSIDWGAIEPGSSKDVMVYIRNEGDAAVMLSMDTVNWIPSDASSYLSLSWDYGGQSVNPDEVVQATLTLDVSPSIEGITSFSFDIVITASG